ncbi:MAG: phosphatase PAP2 family protein [Planctomycetota bacterium]|nr:phosphatase PAP2 family protein [Planctomycetota bacterium]
MDGQRSAHERAPTGAREDPAPLPPRPWQVWRPVWRRRETLGGRWVACASIAALILVNGGGYLLVLHVARWRGITAWDPGTWIDDAIPALPWTIVVYLSLFAYFAAPLACPPRGDRGRLQTLLCIQALVGICAVSFAVFLLLPAQIHVRETMVAALPGEAGWIRALYRFQYFMDQPWNSWPSLHVSQTIVLAFCAQYWSGEVRERRAWLPRGRARTICLVAMWLAWAALAVSILTTKQHFAFDLLTGSLLGALVWVAYLRPALRAAEESDAPAWD